MATSPTVTYQLSCFYSDLVANYGYSQSTDDGYVVTYNKVDNNGRQVVCVFYDDYSVSNWVHKSLDSTQPDFSGKTLKDLDEYFSSGA